MNTRRALISIQTLLVAVVMLALMVSTIQAQTEQPLPKDARHPLEPVDTSSPRATIASFLALTEETARRYLEFRDAPSLSTQNALMQLTEKVERLFDLSQEPPATRRKVADDTFFLLWDVMARLEVPDFAEIPGASAAQVGDEAVELPTSWRIPHTEIVIARVEEGPFAGEFRFSPDTVRQMQRFYETTRELPYLRPMPIENVYRLNQLVTGWMIPPAWVEALPDWANVSVFEQVLWKWCILLLLLVLAVAVVTTVFRWGRRRSWDGSFSSYRRYLSTPLVILVFSWFLWRLATHQINVTGIAAELSNYFFEIARGIAAAWIMWITARWIADAIIASPDISPQSLDASLLRLAARFTGFLAVFVLVFRMAHGLGVPVYGLVAGAGVGGLAVALAARSTLENFIGTLNLYADRPVRVGDFCRYGEDPSPGWLRIGTIEEIGLRSTRIRGIDRTVTTIPNADFCNMHIISLTARDRMLFNKTIHLRYSTTPEQLRRLLTELREMLLAHPRVSDERVRATGLGPYSLDLQIRVYVMTADWNDFLAVQEELIIRITDMIKRAGTAIRHSGANRILQP